jgi:hypothetical protein
MADAWSGGTTDVTAWWTIDGSSGRNCTPVRKTGVVTSGSRTMQR